MLAGLPNESAVARAIRGDKDSWSISEHLLAAAADAVNYTAWLTESVNTEKSKRRKAPKPIRRPDDPPPPVRRKATEAEIRELLGGG